MALNPRVAADGLFIGQVAWLPGDGRGSAIAKTAVDGQWAGKLGLRAEWLRNNARGGAA